MRASTWLVALVAAFTVLAAQAATTAATDNSQQEKMKTCNHDASAKGLKGDARQAYMKTCLSGSAK
jgi:psiF repeat